MKKKSVFETVLKTNFKYVDQITGKRFDKIQLNINGGV